MNRTLFRPEKWSLKKVQKTEIFPIVNNWNFLSIVFFGKSSHKRSILDVLDRKERFLDHKHYLKKPNKTAWVVEVVVVKKNFHQWQRNSICYCGNGDCYFSRRNFRFGMVFCILVGLNCLWVHNNIARPWAYFPGKMETFWTSETHCDRWGHCKTWKKIFDNPPFIANMLYVSPVPLSPDPSLLKAIFFHAPPPSNITCPPPPDKKMDGS